METTETMKNVQDQLFQSIDRRDIDRAKKILSDHPEIATSDLSGGHELEDSTLLIDACRNGEYLQFPITPCMVDAHSKK